MNEPFGTVQNICSQCNESVDTDARFCKYYAFDLGSSGVNQNISTEVDQIRTKRNILGILAAACLLVFLLIGLVLKIPSVNTSQLVAENADSISQAPSLSLTLSEKGQQIEEKILRGEALNLNDLETLTAQELRILRNVHFARYGRKYDSPGLADYFYTRSWYKPIDSYNDKMLTATDEENVRLILSLEKPEIASSTSINSLTEVTTQNNSSIDKESPAELEGKLAGQAQKLLEDYWKNILTKCGDTYYWKLKPKTSKDERNVGIYEGKGNYSIYLDSAKYFPQKELNLAEKLNNEDPQPVEYSAEGIIRFEAFRNYSGGIVGNCGGACGWKNDQKVYVQVVKEKGEWKIGPSYFTSENLPMNCRKLQWRKINFDWYCSSKFGSLTKPYLTGKDANSWRCKFENNISGDKIYAINMDEACRMQHGDSFKALSDDPKNYGSWYCIPK